MSAPICYAGDRAWVEVDGAIVGVVHRRRKP
jgi:hypothetical protein